MVKNICRFFGCPFPTGKYALAMIDDHSRYPVVEVLRSISAKSVIPVMDKIFSLFGVPKELKTDNGPLFQSHEFQNFSEFLGFKHRRIMTKSQWRGINNYAHSRKTDQNS